MARCPECDGTGKVVICRSCDDIIIAGQTRPCCKDPRLGPVEDCEACVGTGQEIEDEEDDEVCPDCGESEEDCTYEEEDEEEEATCPNCGLDEDDCECEEEEDGTEEEEE